MPFAKYANLKGHDEFCEFVQSIQFDQLAAKCVRYYVDKEYSSLLRLHDDELRESTLRVSTELIGYEGPKKGRVGFIRSRLITFLGKDAMFKIEILRSVWLEVLDMLFAGLALNVFDETVIKEEFAVGVDISKRVAKFGHNGATGKKLSAIEWAEALLVFAQLDFSISLDRMLEATQRFSLIGTTLSRARRWCRLLHVYTVVFLKAGGDVQSPLRFKTSGAGGPSDFELLVQRQAAMALVKASAAFAAPSSPIVLLDDSTTSDGALSSSSEQQQAGGASLAGSAAHAHPRVPTATRHEGVGVALGGAAGGPAPSGAPDAVPPAAAAQAMAMAMTMAGHRKSSTPRRFAAGEAGARFQPVEASLHEDDLSGAVSATVPDEDEGDTLSPVLPPTDPLGRSVAREFVNKCRAGGDAALVAFCPAPPLVLPEGRCCPASQADESSEALSVSIAESLSELGMPISGAFVKGSIRLCGAADQEALLYTFLGCLLGFGEDSTPSHPLLAVYFPSVQRMLSLPVSCSQAGGFEGQRLWPATVDQAIARADANGIPHDGYSPDSCLCFLKYS